MDYQSSETVKYPAALPTFDDIKSLRAEQAAAKTETELIELGKRRGYRDPKWWAKRVMAARTSKAYRPRKKA